MCNVSNADPCVVQILLRNRLAAPSHGISHGLGVLEIKLLSWDVAICFWDDDGFTEECR